jgi:hypothetical protein
VANKAHRSGSGLLLRPGHSLLALIHSSAWNRNSANFALLGFSEVSSVFSLKNSYMAYKMIAIWQTHLLHTQPYTAS